MVTHSFLHIHIKLGFIYLYFVICSLYLFLSLAMCTVDLPRLCPYSSPQPSRMGRFSPTNRIPTKPEAKANSTSAK